MYKKDFPFQILLHRIGDEPNSHLKVSFEDFMKILDEFRSCDPNPPEPKNDTITNNNE